MSLVNEHDFHEDDFKFAHEEGTKLIDKTDYEM